MSKPKTAPILARTMQFLKLDVGCGHSPSGDVNVDLDVSSSVHHPEFVLSRKWAKKMPNFVLADGCHLPFRDGVFKETFSSHVIEHVENPMLFIKELIRVTDGKLEIRCPHRYWRPQLESHVSYFGVRWFKKVFKGFPHKTDVVFRTLYGIPFLSFPYEIVVHVFISHLEEENKCPSCHESLIIVEEVTICRNCGYRNDAPPSYTRLSEFIGSTLQTTRFLK